MPNSPSAAKRLRQSKKRRLSNRITKKVIKTSMKKAVVSVEEKNLEQAEADFRAAMAKIDKAESAAYSIPTRLRDARASSPGPMRRRLPRRSKADPSWRPERSGPLVRGLVPQFAP